MILYRLSVEYLNIVMIHFINWIRMFSATEYTGYHRQKEFMRVQGSDPPPPSPSKTSINPLDRRVDWWSRNRDDILDD
jgi:hypothetical protein